jgi:hypothetical protein
MPVDVVCDTPINPIQLQPNPIQHLHHPSMITPILRQELEHHPHKSNKASDESG